MVTNSRVKAFPMESRFFAYRVRVNQGPVYPLRNGVAISVLVSTGSSAPGIDGLHGSRLRVRVASPPEKGRANAEAARHLAAALDKEPFLITGMTSRWKVFVVADIDVETVRRKLGV